VQAKRHVPELAYTRYHTGRAERLPPVGGVGCRLQEREQAASLHISLDLHVGPPFAMDVVRIATEP